MASIESAFIVFGGIIFIGYFGELISKRFAVPSALLLLIIGYLLKLSGYAEVESLLGIQALFGTLALIVLLFDGGLSLNLYEILFKSGRVLLNSIIITILAVVLCTLLFSIMGFNPLIGAILGAIAGGIGSTTTISIVRGLTLPESIKNFLTLESSITDVFSIILAIVLTQALVSGALDVQVIGQGIASRFSVGLLVGLAIGVLSLIALTKIEKGYNYMITFAIVLILFAVTELLAGSGAIAVLVFGVVFGNESAIRKAFRLGPVKKHPLIKQFQAEISFFIRTFFFVFLGIVVTLGSATNLLIALAVIAMLYAARYFSLYVSIRDSQFFPFIKILTAINPRGLATAVLATYPVIVIEDALKAEHSTYLANLATQTSNLPEIAFYVIVLSIVFTTASVPFAARGNNEKKKEGRRACH